MLKKYQFSDKCDCYVSASHQRVHGVDRGVSSESRHLVWSIRILRKIPLYRLFAKVQFSVQGQCCGR